MFSFEINIKEQFQLFILRVTTHNTSSWGEFKKDNLAGKRLSAQPSRNIAKITIAFTDGETRL